LRIENDRKSINNYYFEHIDAGIMNLPAAGIINKRVKADSRE